MLSLRLDFSNITFRLSSAFLKEAMTTPGLDGALETFLIVDFTDTFLIWSSSFIIEFTLLFKLSLSLSGRPRMAIFNDLSLPVSGTRTFLTCRSVLQLLIDPLSKGLFERFQSLINIFLNSIQFSIDPFI